MPGGTVKGITIEFNGKTEKLNKALSDINKQTKSVDSELKSVNNALKFNPKSTELLAQKQTLLKQKISDTKQSLTAMKAAMDKANADDSTDKNSAEYRKLQREIITTESKVKHFEAELSKVNRMKLTQLGEQFTKVGNKMKSIGQGMSMYITTPIVAGLAAGVKAASDENEAMDKVDAVFKRNSKTVMKYAETSLQAHGIEKGAALEMMGTYGNMAQAQGSSRKESAKMSKALISLAGDMASFNNASPEETMNALQGIFTGQTRALKTYGINLKETSLNQYALAHGFGETYSKLSPQQQMMVRYGLAMEQAKNQTGDFTRTHNKAANQMRIFKGNLKEASAVFGEVILPVVNKAMQSINKLMQKVEKLNPHARKAIVVFGLIAAAIGPVLIVVGTLISSIGAIMTAIGGVSAAAIFTAAPIIVAILAVIGIIVIVVTHLKQIKAWFGHIKDGAMTAINWIKAHFVDIIIALNPVLLLLKVFHDHWGQIKAKAGDCLEGIKTKFGSMKESIGTHMNSIKSKISNGFADAKNSALNHLAALGPGAYNHMNRVFTAVKNVIAKIKAVFDRVRLKLNMKIPYVSLKGGKAPWGIAGKGRLPSFNVHWFRNGGIFDSPSVIGVGEAGKEAVVPIDKLQDYISQANNENNKVLLEILKSMQSGNGGLTVNVYSKTNSPIDDAREFQRKAIQMGLTGR